MFWRREDGENGPSHPAAASRRPAGKRARAPAVALSLTGHALILAALVFARPQPPEPPEAPAMEVGLFDAGLLQGPEPPSPAPPAATPPAPPKAVEKKKPAPKKPVVKAVARTTPRRPPPEVETLAASEEPEVEYAPEVTEAELASAATVASGAGAGAGAGIGGGGGGSRCDMLRMLQDALRKDPMVQAAVASHRASGWGRHAIRIWNGDWVMSRGQEGKGLAAVRQAMIWEIGFAPQACRTQPMRGQVLISLADSPGAPRLLVGSGSWRWSDLVVIR